jgi:replicative DNA helicase
MIAPEEDFKTSRRAKATLADPTKIDRLPPHSIEAEQGVLGCIMLDPSTVFPVVALAIKNPEAFYDLRHRTIFEVMIEMFDKREPVDLIMLQQKLKDRQQLEGVGGLVYLASLPDAVPSAANIEHYLGIVSEKFTVRKLIGFCTEAVGRAYEHQGSVDTLLDEVEQDIHTLSENAQSSDHTATAKQLIHGTISKIEELFNNQGQIGGVPTGFYDIDKMTGGLNGGDMVVIAARPSVGKTSLAVNIAEYVALSHHSPVAIASLEMTSQQLMLRMVSSISRVPSDAIKHGNLTQQHFQKINSAALRLNSSNIIIDDSSGLSILQLKSKARRIHQRYGIKLLIIDYLQLLHSTNRKSENRQQEVADISSGCKQIAKELNIPVIVLSQLNRESEKAGNRKPRISDLRESGAIEQDADQIWLLYRPDDQEETADKVFQVDVVIAKSRNGPTGEVHLLFNKPITKFESITTQQAP